MSGLDDSGLGALKRKVRKGVVPDVYLGSRVLLNASGAVHSDEMVDVTEFINNNAHVSSSKNCNAFPQGLHVYRQSTKTFKRVVAYVLSFDPETGRMMVVGAHATQPIDAKAMEQFRASIKSIVDYFNNTPNVSRERLYAVVRRPDYDRILLDAAVARCIYKPIMVSVEWSKFNDEAHRIMYAQSQSSGKKNKSVQMTYEQIMNRLYATALLEEGMRCMSIVEVIHADPADNMDEHDEIPALEPLHNSDQEVVDHDFVESVDPVESSDSVSGWFGIYV